MDDHTPAVVPALSLSQPCRLTPSLPWQQGSDRAAGAGRASPAAAIGRSGQGPALLFHSYKGGGRGEVMAKAASEVEVMLMFGFDPSSEENMAVFRQFKTEGGSEKVFLSPCSLTLLCCVSLQIWHRKNMAFWVRQAYAE